MEPTDNKGDIARKIRSKRGRIKQKDFAKLINVHKDQLSRYETGKSIPRAEIYQRIMEFRHSEKGVEFTPSEGVLSLREGGVDYEFHPTEIKKLLDSAREVLESGNKYAGGALAANIKAFLEMVRISKNDNEDKKKGGQESEKS
jgi:transcriptional regulator with XRE-family HTH domain